MSSGRTGAQGLRAAVAVCLAALGLVAGCAPSAQDGEPDGATTTQTADGSAYHGTMLAGRPRPPLRLRNTSGEWFDLQQRPTGETTVLFSGYTHCPDVCPTTMANLGAAYRMLLHGVRDDLAVVFVTEDPARDTPALLRRWLDRYSTDFVGLIGGLDRTARVAKELDLPKARIDPHPDEPIEHPPSHRHDAHTHGDGHADDDYGVSHSGIVYIFGPHDRTLIYTGGTTPSQYAADLTRVTG